MSTWRGFTPFAGPYLLVRPPRPGEASYERYEREKGEVLEALRRNVELVGEA